MWEGSDSNSGTLLFCHWLVEWNGCGETYPGEQPTGCWAQTAGGYGDGVGTGATGGDWIIEESAFLHNTSDRLDLLYHSLGGRVSLDQVRAEGNAGNQVKVAGQLAITNSVLVGNCAFFDPGDVTFLFYQEGCPGLFFAGDYSIAYQVKNTEAPWMNPPYPSAHNLLQDPLLTEPFTGTTYGMMLSPSSPAIDAGTNAVCPATDYRGFPRPVDGNGDGTAICDMGAYEFGASKRLYLPLILKGYVSSATSHPES